MNEPIKPKPESPKRSRRKPAMEPLGWDEIVSQPGMGGYLSFLNGPVPLPHLQSNSGVASIPGVAPVTVTAPSPPQAVTDPGVDLITEAATAPEVAIVSEPVRDTGSEISSGPYIIADTRTTSGIDIVSRADSTSVHSDPVVESAPEPGTDPDSAQITPGAELIPGFPATHRVRIRKCAAAHDGHSLGEEVLYQALWKAAAAESAESRMIVIGWRGMSQLCRMTPKNCKINTQRLIRKLALEVLSPYNTPESIGTTYRVFSEEAIVRRRRGAGLEWVIRSRGVEFVDPKTGSSIAAHLCAYVSE